MKPNKEGYWIFRGEIVRVSETWKDRFIFHKFRSNLDYDVVETNDSDWGPEITMEPAIRLNIQEIAMLKKGLTEWIINRQVNPNSETGIKIVKLEKKLNEYNS